ncbi:MAG: AbgT family transporter [Prevotella sp.]|jgi:aminobenzoyl-glutamate transport protein|nr:AbgT family transporter [Prevotella sp.]
MKIKRTFGYLAAMLLLALVVLVLVSWLLSATQGEGVRSLLSSEGIRFFFGCFTDMLRKPLLVWLLLLSMAWGCLCESGLLQFFSEPLPRHRRRQTLILLSVVTAIYIGMMMLLTVTPQAVLLSATGQLWPSPFSHALVPVIAFGIVMLSVAYGLMARRFLSIADVCQSLTHGIVLAAPLFLLYILVMQFVGALRFVFG